MSKTERWYIQEGFYLETAGAEVVSLVYEPDATSILIATDEFDDMIDALKRARAHYKVLEAKEAERKKLACWGKARTPTGIEISPIFDAITGATRE